MSYKEKTIWLSLFILLFIWIEYALEFFGLNANGQLSPEAINSLLKIVIIKTIFLEIVLQIVLAVIDHKNASTDPDERDKVISLHASRYAYLVLSIGVAISVFYVIAPALTGLLLPTFAIDIHYKVIQLVIFFMVLAEVVNLGTRLFYYRRGF